MAYQAFAPKQGRTVRLLSTFNTLSGAVGLLNPIQFFDLRKSMQIKTRFLFSGNYKAQCCQRSLAIMRS